MSFTKMLQQCLRKANRARGRKPSARTNRIRLDSLEDRTAPAVGGIQFAATTDSGAEGGPADLITVTLITEDLNLAGGNVTVDLIDNGGGTATSGTDYSALGTITFTFNNSSSYVLNAGNRIYTQTTTLPVTDDQRVEGAETVNLKLQNITHGFGDTISSGFPSTQTYTINDNDSVTVAFSDTANIAEGGATDTVDATLTLNTSGSGTAGLDVSVIASITSATGDFTVSTPTPEHRAIWNAGDAPGTKQITVTATDDVLVEATPEALVGTHAVTTIASFTTSGTANVSVTDNDSATVTISNGTTGVTEGGAGANVLVTLAINASGSGGTPQLAVPVVVDLTGDDDYSTTPATFVAGSTAGSTVNIAVAAVNDQKVEATPENINATLVISNANGANVDTTDSGTRTIAVTDNDSATVAITAGTTTVTEGSSQNITATLTLATNGTGTAEIENPIGVNLNTASNADYTATGATFAAGAVSGATVNISVYAEDDRRVEVNPENFTGRTLTITAGGGSNITVAGSSGSRTISIADNDSANIAITSPGTTTVTEGAGSQNLGVTLALTTTADAGHTGDTATLDTTASVKLPDNADYFTTPATFVAGALHGATANVVVTAVNDQIIEPAESFTGQALTLTTAPGSPVNITASGSQTINVGDNDTATVSITSATTTVTEGGASQNIVATLSLSTSGSGTPMLDQSVTVNLAPGDGTDNVDWSSVAAVFAAGATDGTTANIVVTATDDQRVEQPTEINEGGTQSLSLSANGQAVSGVGTQNIDVVDNDSATVAIPSATTAVTEGGADATIVATLTLNTTGTGTAELENAFTVGLNIATNADYTTADGTFAAGAVNNATANIVVSDVDDQLVEGNPENFTGRTLAITSGGGSNITVGGTSGTQTIQVLENDSANVTITSGGPTTVTEGGATDDVTVQIELITSGAGTQQLATTVSVKFPDNADYFSTAGTFAAGALDGDTKIVQVGAVDDQLVEPAESFTGQALTLVTPPGTPANITVSGSRTINVVDNDSATVSISSGTTTVTEGAVGQNVVATLNFSTTGSGTPALQNAVVVDLTPLNGGVDWTSANATFAAGALNGATADIVVTAVDDRRVEMATEIAAGGNQTLTIINANGQGVTVDSGSGIRTIDVNDNDSATVTVGAGPTTVAEGGGSQNLGVTLTLATPGSGTQQTDVAISANLPGNADYTPTAATFPVGSLHNDTANISIVAVDDQLIENPTETFAGQALSITSTGGANVAASGSSTVVVTDGNDAAVVSIVAGTTAVTEGGASVPLQSVLTLTTSGTGPQELAIAVTANLPGNADYSSTAASFPIGTTTGATSNLNVSATNDQIVEAFESYTGQALAIVTPGTPRNVTATGSRQIDITDNDSATVAITSGTTTVKEGDPGVNVVATLTLNTNGSGPASLGVAVDVDLTPQDDDWTTVDGTFAAGAVNGATANIVVNAVDDRRVEPSPEVAAGGNQTLVVANANGAAVTVGGTSGIRTINVLDNDRAVLNYNGTANVTEGVVTPVPISVELTLDTIGSGPILLDTQVQATLVSPTNDFTASTVTWNGGDPPGPKSIDVFAIDDRLVEKLSESHVAVLQPITAAVVEATGSVTVNVTSGNDTAVVGITSPGSTAVTEGGVSANVGVTLTINATGSGNIELGESVTANLPGNADYTTVAGVFNAGAGNGATRNIVVTAVDDNLVEVPIETFAGQTLSVASTATVTSDGTQQTIQVVDNDTANVTINDVTVTEGGTISFTVNLSAPLDIPVDFLVNYTDVSATGGGVDYDSGTDTVSFAAGESGNKTVTVSTVNDSADESTETFTAALSVSGSTPIGSRPVATSDTGTGTIVDNDNGAPVVSNRNFTINEDTAISATFTATDPENDPVTFSIVTQPTNGTVNLDPQTGQFTYTPNLNYNGADTFTYRATEVTGSPPPALQSNIGTVSITINPINDAPVAQNGTLTTNEDSAAPGVLVATDVDVPTTLVYSLVALPANGQITGFNSSTGAYTYTPNPNYNGPDSFTFKANDGIVDSNIATISITVNPVNDPPVANNNSLGTNEDNPLIGSVTATDVDNNPLTFSLVANATNGNVIVNANGTFVYTPNLNYNGPDSFTFKANDGIVDSNVATISITVNPINDPPVATGESQTTAEDTPVSGNLDATDVESPTLTYTILTSPSNGTLTSFNSSTGAYTYTPNLNFNGNDLFTFKANDGTADSNTAAVTITVTPVNDAPVANNNNLSTNEDVPLIGSVTASDVDNDPLTFSMVSNAANGTVVIAPNGTFTYTPNLNYFGPDSFTFRANDGTVNSNTATINITVNPVNDPPVAFNGSLTTDEDQSASGNMVATDVDNVSLTYSVLSGPSNGTLTSFNSATGAFTYTPNADFFGADLFTFKVNDGSVDSNTAVFNITVNPINDAPVLTDNAVIPTILQATTDPVGRKVSSLFDGLVTDADPADTLAGIAVVGNPQDPDQGTWQYSTDDGTTWFNIGAVADNATALALSAATTVRFLPEPFFFGDPTPLTVRGIDSTFAGAFTSGATRQTVNPTPNGGTTPFSAGTKTILSPVFPSDVVGVWLSTSGNLFISGGSGRDTSTVFLANKNTELRVRMNNLPLDKFPLASVTGTIYVRMNGGNDRVVISNAVNLPSEVYGGTGNDTLLGGAATDVMFGEAGNDVLNGRKGNNLLVGGDGNDVLRGGTGRDVLIGSDGGDRMFGGLGTEEDMLVAGKTTFEGDLSDISALLSIFNEWTSTAPYNTRVAHLTGLAGGLNGTNFLNGSTVINDGVKDVTRGQGGTDWFVVSALDVTDVKTGETSTTII